jgi:hypothetical protein
LRIREVDVVLHAGRDSGSGGRSGEGMGELCKGALGLRALIRCEVRVDIERGKRSDWLRGSRMICCCRLG